MIEAEAIIRLQRSFRGEGDPMGNGYGTCSNCRYGHHAQCSGKQCSCADNGHN